jgi:hypothetical protein
MTNKGENPVDPQEAVSLFPRRKFSQVARFGAIVDGAPAYFRPGHLRTRGYLVNIGLSIPFGRSLLRGEGFLCMNRGRCYLIPMADLRHWLRPKLTKGRVMVDIYLDPKHETLFTPGLGRLSIFEFRGS